jgi:hypothetical protein
MPLSAPMSPSATLLSPESEKLSPLNATHIITKTRALEPQPIPAPSYREYQAVLKEIQHLEVFCDEDDDKELFCAAADLQKLRDDGMWRSNKAFVYDTMLDLRKLLQRLEKRARKHRRAARRQLKAAMQASPSVGPATEFARQRAPMRAIGRRAAAHAQASLLEAAAAVLRGA